MIEQALGALGIAPSLKPHLIMLDESYMPFAFTVPPTDFSVSSSQSHESVNIIDFGEKYLDGTQGCLKISWSGIFLHSRHSWVPNGEYMLGQFIPPKVCEETIRSYMVNNEKLKLFIPEWLEYIKCKIESFEITHRDHTGDIYYNISLIQEREGLSSTGGIIEKVDNFISEKTSSVMDKITSAPIIGDVSIDTVEFFAEQQFEMGKEILAQPISGLSEVGVSAMGKINGLLERPGAIPLDTKSSVV